MFRHSQMAKHYIGWGSLPTVEATIVVSASIVPISLPSSRNRFGATKGLEYVARVSCGFVCGSPKTLHEL